MIAPSKTPLQATVVTGEEGKERLRKRNKLVSLFLRSSLLGGGLLGGSSLLALLGLLGLCGLDDTASLGLGHDHGLCVLNSGGLYGVSDDTMLLRFDDTYGLRGSLLAGVSLSRRCLLGGSLCGGGLFVGLGGGFGGGLLSRGSLLGGSGLGGLLCGGRGILLLGGSLGGLLGGSGL